MCEGEGRSRTCDVQDGEVSLVFLQPVPLVPGGRFIPYVRPPLGQCGGVVVSNPPPPDTCRLVHMLMLMLGVVIQ